MFVLLDKPSGISSFKFIKKYSIEKNIKKIGHTGTLDPLASGLLLVATGQSTKLISYINNETKEYIAEMEFGKNTTTYDSEGEVTSVCNQVINEEDFNKVLNSFLGKYNQIPPNFSAKKINGKRAYKLARENKEFQLKANEVEIFNIEKLEFNFPIAKFKVKVSKGTYIRSLIVDIAKKLNSCAFMSGLRRTMIGNLSIDDIDKDIDVSKLLAIETVDLTMEQLLKIKHGRSINLEIINKKMALFNNEIVAIIAPNKNLAVPKKVFSEIIDKIEYNNGSNKV
ncbi:MAG: tRNA pseudouridine(55) synthase TruB [Mycoplasma sp.]|nr:tRNA pseudouridine(55) synthase TruB [Mycoplasma sp.]